MLETTITLAEAAEALGVAKTTLKTWVDRLPIPTELNARGRRTVGPCGFELLRLVQDLRAADHDFETIRAMIGPVPDSALQVAVVDPPPAAVTFLPASPGGNEALVAGIADMLLPRLQGALDAHTELADRYAGAARRIGELEARVEALTAELSAARGWNEDLDALAGDAKPWWKLW